MTASVGLIVDDVSNPFFAAVQRGVEHVARAHGALTLVGCSDERAEQEAELAEAFAAHGVDGLVIVPCAGDRHELPSGIPLVFVDRAPRGMRSDTVVSDNAGGARAAVEHLLDVGHRRVAFLGDRLSVPTAAERRDGYRAALAAAGIARAPELEITGLSSSATAAQAVLDLLRGPRPPTAIFSAQNLITIGAVRALHELGLHWTVALAGFDDIVLGDLLEPGVTVVAQDPYALGRRAGELLFERRAGGAREPRRVVVPTQLLARGSGEIPSP